MYMYLKWWHEVVFGFLEFVIVESSIAAVVIAAIHISAKIFGPNEYILFAILIIGFIWILSG